MGESNLLPGVGNRSSLEITPSPLPLPNQLEKVSEEDKAVAKGLGKGEFLTRPLTTASSRKASVELSTAEGDRVTLTYERTESKTTYIRPVGGYVPGLAEEQTPETSLSMEVQGDLNGQELSDLEAFKEAVAESLEGFLSRQTTETEEIDTLDMSVFDSLTEYAVALDTATSTSWASSMVKGYTSPEYDPAAPGANQETEPEIEPDLAPDISSEPELEPGTKIESGSGSGPEPDPEPESGSESGPESKTSAAGSKSAASHPQAMTAEETAWKDQPLPSKLSHLREVTDRVFEQVGQAAPDQYDALDVLSKRYSGLLERVMDIFEGNDRVSHIIDRWA